MRCEPSRTIPEGQTQADPDGAVERRHMCEQPAVSHGLDSAAKTNTKLRWRKSKIQLKAYKIEINTK